MLARLDISYPERYTKWRVHQLSESVNASVFLRTFNSYMNMDLNYSVLHGVLDHATIHHRKWTIEWAHDPNYRLLPISRYRAYQNAMTDAQETLVGERTKYKREYARMLWVYQTKLHRAATAEHMPTPDTAFAFHILVAFAPVPQEHQDEAASLVQKRRLERMTATMDLLLKDG